MKITRQEAHTILEIQDGATQEIIRSAYLKKSRECHPDKRPESERAEATAAFQRIGASYKILSQQGTNSSDEDEDPFGGGFHGGDMSDLFEMFAHMAASQARARGMPSGGGPSSFGPGAFLFAQFADIFEELYNEERYVYDEYYNSEDEEESDEYDDGDEYDDMEEAYARYYAGVRHPTDDELNANFALARDRWLNTPVRPTRLKNKDVRKPTCPYTEIILNLDPKETRIEEYAPFGPPPGTQMQVAYRAKNATGAAGAGAGASGAAGASAGNGNGAAANGGRKQDQDKVQWCTVTMPWEGTLGETDIDLDEYQMVIAGLAPGTEYIFKSRASWYKESTEEVVVGPWSAEAVFSTDKRPGASNSTGGGKSSAGKGAAGSGGVAAGSAPGQGKNAKKKAKRKAKKAAAGGGGNSGDQQAPAAAPAAAAAQPATSQYSEEKEEEVDSDDYGYDVEAEDEINHQAGFAAVDRVMNLAKEHWLDPPTNPPACYGTPRQTTIEINMDPTGARSLKYTPFGPPPGYHMELFYRQTQGLSEVWYTVDMPYETSYALRGNLEYVLPVSGLTPGTSYMFKYRACRFNDEAKGITGGTFEAGPFSPDIEVSTAGKPPAAAAAASSKSSGGENAATASAAAPAAPTSNGVPLPGQGKNAEKNARRKAKAREKKAAAASGTGEQKQQQQAASGVKPAADSTAAVPQKQSQGKTGAPKAAPKMPSTPSGAKSAAPVSSRTGEPAKNKKKEAVAPQRQPPPPPLQQQQQQQQAAEGSLDGAAAPAEKKKKKNYRGKKKTSDAGGGGDANAAPSKT